MKRNQESEKRQLQPCKLKTDFDNDFAVMFTALKKRVQQKSFTDVEKGSNYNSIWMWKKRKKTHLGNIIFLWYIQSNQTKSIHLNAF